MLSCYADSSGVRSFNDEGRMDEGMNEWMNE